MRIIAKTLSGLEGALAHEIRTITGKNTEILKRAVSFEGELEDLYKVNYRCRTLLRALLEVDSQKINSNEEAFYDFIYTIDWSKYFDVNKTFAVDAVTYSEVMRNDNFLALKAKDAIVDQFRNKVGSRPNVDGKNPDLRIHVHISSFDVVSVSLDSSGESLHKRGYRTIANTAPINEVLAAGIIYLSGWDRKESFFDPMCGSGTFSAEALMMAAEIPARYLKPTFAFQKWNNYNFKDWLKIKNEADSMMTLPKCEIISQELSHRFIKLAQQNIEHLPFGELVTVTQRNFLSEGKVENCAKMFINPPYDRRMHYSEINDFYKSIGDKLKNDYQGTETWVISGNTDAMKSFGLRPSKKISVYNGPMPCFLYKFETYSGSRKGTFQNKQK